MTVCRAAPASCSRHAITTSIGLYGLYVTILAHHDQLVPMQGDRLVTTQLGGRCNQSRLAVGGFLGTKLQQTKHHAGRLGSGVTTVTFRTAIILADGTMHVDAALGNAARRLRGAAAVVGSSVGSHVNAENAPALHAPLDRAAAHVRSAAASFDTRLCAAAQQLKTTAVQAVHSYMQQNRLRKDVTALFEYMGAWLAYRASRMFKLAVGNKVCCHVQSDTCSCCISL